MHIKNQRGYALLVTAIIIILGITITALITARTMYFSQKEQNNQYNQNLAFQAAEAGLEYGTAYLFNNEATIVKDLNNNGYIDAYNDSSLTNVSFIGGATYTVSMLNTIPTDFSTIEIVSVGSADNNATTRIIKQLVRIFPLMVSSPPAGVVTHSGVALNGNVTITNQETGSTIWSGGNVSLAGSARTDAGDGSGSDRNGLNSDVVRNDEGLSSLSGDQFFSGFFGRTKTEAQQTSDLVYNNSSNTNYSSLLNGVTGKAIWINQTGGTASLSSNATIGSADRPVILIVNGPFKANANIVIYGLVYVIGDWDNSGGGTVDVNGSIIVEGTLTGQGTPNVNFSNTILSNLSQVGEYVKVPGSWHDF